MRVYTVILLICVVCCVLRGGEGPAGGSSSSGIDAAHFAGLCSNMETDHFRLIHDLRSEQAEAIGQVLEFAYGQFGAYFSRYGFELKHPELPLEWMCFRREGSFADYALATERMDLSWLSGYYSSRTNRVAVVGPRRVGRWRGGPEGGAEFASAGGEVVDVGLVKIVHEAGHQLAFNTGLQKRGVMYPMWATEGVALVFEDCASDYLPTVRYSEARKKRLLELYREGLLIRLDDFVTMVRVPSGIPEADIYAQAWGFFLFLCENRTADLRDYFDYLYSLKSGARTAYHLRREFFESFGEIGELEREWSFFLELSAVSKPFLAGAPNRN